MATQKTFPYLQALYFGFSKLIDNFKTIFLLALSWGAILYTTVVVLGSVLFRLSYPGAHGSQQWIVTIMKNPSELLVALKSLSVTTLSVFGSITLLLFICYNLVHLYQLLHLSQSIYKANPLRVRDLFHISIKDFLTFACARIIFWLKLLLANLPFLLLMGYALIEKSSANPIILVGGFLIAMLCSFLGIYIITTYYFTGYSLITNTTDSISEDSHLSALITYSLKWQMLFVLFMIPAASYFVNNPALAMIAGFVFFSPLLSLTSIHLYHSLKSTQLTRPAYSEN